MVLVSKAKYICALCELQVIILTVEILEWLLEWADTFTITSIRSGEKLRHREGRLCANDLLLAFGRAENRSLAYYFLSQDWIFLAISYSLPACETEFY